MNGEQIIIGMLERLTQNVEVLTRDVGELKQDVAVLKEDVGELKQDVAVLKEDVVELKQDVAVLKQDVEQLNDKVHRIDHLLEGIKDQTANTAEDATVIRQNFDDLKVCMEYFKEQLHKRVCKINCVNSPINLLF